ncbi:uncharacterized protein LOC100370724 [Saccoglossus kowalevskii]|uniref:Stress response protein NST1-like n=1 Tax=Saccoglossus kowalevskii TaxID=10224 RepID=A0ABM0GVQ1_SACKO|nr:PREDICTED: stress response protein NST1-like [Saccoglossus kowalevskii]
MNKYVLSFMVALLSFTVVCAVSPFHQSFDRSKRIIEEDEEKDLPELTRIKRVRREENADEDDDVQARIKRVRKETKVITHQLEKALTRTKRIDVEAEEKKDPTELDRVKRYRRDFEENPDGLKRVKRVRKDTDDEEENSKELTRMKRVRRDIETPIKRSLFRKGSSGDALNRVKRLEAAGQFESHDPELKRFKRVRRLAETPDIELKRLRKRSDDVTHNAEERLTRMKRMK